MSSLVKQRSFWFGALLIATSAAILFLNQNRFSSKPTAPLPILGQAVDFQLTERSGKMISLADLKGKVWIADFIFTRCAGICPMMSLKMQRIQEKLKENPGVRFVSFSVDPQYDTPQVLQEYAKRFRADRDRWLFLTGDKAQIFKLSQQHFHLGVADIPEAERAGGLDQSVAHSSKFVLIDTLGQIRGYYSSEDESSMEKLARDVKEIE